MENKSKKVQDLLGEIDTQKRKTGVFTPPTAEEIEQYRKRRLEQSLQSDAVLSQLADRSQPAAEPKEEKKESRSLRELLQASSREQSREVGRMLAPTLERGFDDIGEPDSPEDAPSAGPAAPESAPEAGESAPPAEKKEPDITAHPLFTTSRSVDIERVKKEMAQTEDLAAAIAKNVSRAAPTRPNSVQLDAVAARHSTEGILNVRDKVNDEFREFFGDTVIIDRDPDTARRTRQRHIKDFVPAAVGSEARMVFDDDIDIPDDEPEEFIEEYRSEEDTEPIMAELLSMRAAALLRAVFGGAAAAAVIVLDLLAGFGGEGGPVAALAASPAVWEGIHLAMAVLLIGLCAKSLLKGLRQMFTVRGGAESGVVTIALAMLVEPAAHLATAQRSAAHIAVPVGCFALFLMLLGQAIAVFGVLRSFNAVSSAKERYVSFLPENDELNRRLTREAGGDSPRILLKRKTGFSDNFMQMAFSVDENSLRYPALPLVLLALSLACGVAAYLRAGELPAAFTAFSLCAALSAGCCCLLRSALPLAHMQKAASRRGVVLPGFSSADQLSDAGAILMDGRELFPRGTVLLHGIKTFGKERIDRAILYAASVLIPSCETLSPVFLNVIQGKKDMLYKTEDIVYEDRMGFSAWADGARVLIGNREMMAAHEIPMPSREYELQYTKTKKRDAIYLAVGGSLYAMFVVSYNLSTDVEASIRRLTDEGLFLVVRTNDFCITRQRISEVYGLPISSVSVLKKADMEAVADELTYKAHSRSIISHIGTLPSYTAGILACRHLLRCLDVTGIALLLGQCLGAVIAVAMAVLGSVGAVGLWLVLAYQLIWLAIDLIISAFARC